MKSLAYFGMMLALGTGAASAQARTPVTVLSGDATTLALVIANIDVEAYRAVKVQTIVDAQGQTDHLLVHLAEKGQHRVSFAAIKPAGRNRAAAVTMNYALGAADFAQQPGGKATARCPDEAIEFIAICPNDDELEIRITKEVADAARAKDLKVIELLKEGATRQAYLNYMSCPKLRGNFYDGDADPTVITTFDGVLSSRDIGSALRSKFRHEVTNIWLACQAFNDPMLSTMITTTQSRKYAAGKNDLQVGPSDEAAGCAMKAALDGKPMTAAFKQCYDDLDTTDDLWGFEGDGTDDFWH